MEEKPNTIITVKASIHAPIDKVWKLWTSPDHITQWNFASDEWQCPHAINDLQPEGKFSFRMEAKDGSFGFDFNGVYLDIIPLKWIEYHLEDGRSVNISFAAEGTQCIVTESFEADKTHSAAMQESGWQVILNNFKKYAEQ